MNVAPSISVAPSALPVDASERAEAVFAAIVDVHEDEGVYLDVTSSSWPQIVIVQGYAADYRGSATYMLDADGALTVTRDPDDIARLDDILEAADEWEGA